MSTEKKETDHLPTNADWQGVDKAPGGEQGKAEK